MISNKNTKLQGIIETEHFVRLAFQWGVGLLSTTKMPYVSQFRKCLNLSL